VRSGLGRAALSGWWRRGRRRQANTEAGLSGCSVGGRVLPQGAATREGNWRAGSAARRTVGQAQGRSEAGSALTGWMRAACSGGSWPEQEQLGWRVSAG
jgi:hypothetical protein